MKVDIYKQGTENEQHGREGMTGKQDARKHLYPALCASYALQHYAASQQLFYEVDTIRIFMRISSVRRLESTQSRIHWTPIQGHCDHRRGRFPEVISPGTWVSGLSPPSAPHLLLDATGIRHPLIWLSSVSEISICRGSLGTHTVTSSWEVKCLWVKFTVVCTWLFISFPFTKMESQWLETFGRIRILRCISRKTQAPRSSESSWTLIY